MKEIWKDIKGYEGIYQVSNYGNVKNIKTNKMKVPNLSNKGYLRVLLSNNKIKKQCSIHRLVADAFIDNPFNLKQVNHKDENKLNNNVNNLEWCTCQYNVDYSISKKINQYDLDKNFIRQWKSVSDASRNLNIPDNCIIQCCKKKQHRAGNYIWEYTEDRKVVYS
jgi:hypothetical protein